MSILELFLIFISGCLAGFINIIAGGGLLITFPILIFFGLPAGIANGTVRLAVFFESLVGIYQFNQKKVFEKKISLKLGIPAIIGAIIGSNTAVFIPDKTFNTILAFFMIGVLLLILFNSKLQSKKHLLEQTKVGQILIYPVFFLIGFYGGIIQIGVGFILIAALSLFTSKPLSNINSIKTFIIGAYMLFSLIIFIFHGKINWTAGIILALGNGIGAYIGAHFAVHKGEGFIKIILSIAVITLSIKLLHIF